MKHNIVYPPEGVYEKYEEERVSRKISPLLLSRILACAERFTTDNEVDEYYFAGSVANLTVWDEQTKEEEPIFWSAKWAAKTWNGVLPWKYSDIDLVIPNRPELVGVYRNYRYVIDVGNFSDTLMSRTDLLRHSRH